ncbi:GAF domain-containing protein [Antarcticirhabdus aurantiaca]|uniref:PAS domain S-box protein n=1 Tax=Antarcticirhabdus aurantiaca TaxID=2606717 RepID=A0ACD4NR83_9HYPH|nr:GAF domain-containing protein [Antarcticirhabdus aurantiaca]WAJ29474.1 PAS domain S-box protein [Jeongeuplla avenae]
MQNEPIEAAWDEDERVAALDRYRILDTPPETEFDDIARIAADVCGTPIAVVNLVSRDRQFFKAEVGLGVRETPLDTSFCRHALLERDFLVVPDARKDPRLQHNPLVTGEAGLRFYAGALLKTEEGLPLGTVCVLDYEPRHLTERQLGTLRALARQAMSQMRLRLALAEREENAGMSRRHAAQLQALAQASLEVGAAPTMEAKLEAITGIARRIVGAHQSVVSMTRGPDWSQAINAVSMSERYDRWRDYGRMPDGSGIYAWACEVNEPIRMTQAELEAHPRWRGFGGHAPDHPPMRGWLAAPMIARDGRNLGLIQLSDKEGGGEFDASDEAILLQLAQLASTAIEEARTEARLRETTRRLDAVLNNASVSIFLMDERQHCVYMNAAAERLTGYSLDEVQGRPLHDVIHHTHPDGRPFPIEDCAIDRAFPENNNTRGEEVFVHRDGSFYPVAFTASPIRDEAAKTVGTIIEVRDIRDEKAAREALARHGEELETLVAERTEELERTHEALRQSQKMEAVGQLTGGVAHDFNNLLQIVIGNLDLIQRNLPEEAARLRRAAGNAMTGAKRAATLTQRLLAFSRRQPLEPRPISVNRLVTNMSDLLDRTLGETIEIETILSGSLWQVEADPNQLEAAILNLAVNARDAMPGGGKLTIETANTYLDHGYVAHNAEVQPGQYVVICVSDTGTGMDKQTMSKVFEPFFTTKEVGKGTGLGLSQVYGFVKQSGGNVKIYSEVDEGTTVKIYLPRRVGSAAEEQAGGEGVAPEGNRLETILVLEDDDDVRAYSAEVLRELGYRVLEAGEGASALRLLDREDGKVDLLFSDVVLPGGMSGAVVAEEARKRQPKLKVLFTTGYARNAIVHQGRLDHGVELLTKPFTFTALATRVRDILDRRD